MGALIREFMGTARSSPRFQQVQRRHWDKGLLTSRVSFAQRIVEDRDEVVPAACLVSRSAEMFRGGRRGELSSLAGEAVAREEPQ